VAAGAKPLAQIYTELNATIHAANLLLLECQTSGGSAGFDGYQ